MAAVSLGANEEPLAAGGLRADGKTQEGVGLRADRETREGVGLGADGESLAAVSRVRGCLLLALDIRDLAGPGASKRLAAWLLPTSSSGERLKDR